MPELEPVPKTDVLSPADLEATLRDLLIRFRDVAAEEPEQIERFARAGTEAILTQLRQRPWLSSGESAATSGVSEAMVRERVQQHQIPAVRGADQKLRIHRRDLSLYQLSQRLGATEEQITPLTPPIAWSDEDALDGWHELWPG